MQVFVKDPQSKLDYQVDWTAWLVGDTISTSTWTVPTGLTKGTDVKTSATATVWISGGTAGAAYTVMNHVTTTAGRIDECSFSILIEDK